MTFKRILLARRRIDTWLLVAAFVALALLNPAGKAILVFFAGCGVYLAASRHGALRWAPPAFSLALLAYCVWSIGLSLLRGEPIIGNRLLSYAAIEMVVLALPIGLCLVQRPLDAMVTGARIGIVVLCVAAPIEYAVTGERVGLGNNEAILAFVAMASGLMSRIEVARAFGWLPNGRFWPYLVLVPVVLTQTRAALFVMPLVLIADLAGGYATRDGRPIRRTVLFAGVALVVILAVPLAAILADRMGTALREIAHFQATGDGFGSVNIRLVMWSSALQVLADNPLIGVGSTARMAAVGALSGANEYLVVHYTHLHNFLLDEALSSGLVGLVLLLSVFGAFLATLLRSPVANGRLKETGALFTVLVLTFGLFHGVILNEWMIVVVFGFMSIALTDLRRRSFRPHLPA